MQLSSTDISFQNQQLDIPRCRVCMQSTPTILTLPCFCLSGNAHIHWTCLKNTKQFDQRRKCDICKGRFEVQYLYQDEKRITKCSKQSCCKCSCEGGQELFYLILKLMWFFDGCYFCLRPAFQNMQTFSNYLSIGLGVIGLCISLVIRKVEIDKLKVYLCCYCNWRTSSNFEIICCWCTKFKTWIPKKCIGVNLYTKTKSIQFIT